MSKKSSNIPRNSQKFSGNLQKEKSVSANNHGLGWKALLSASGIAAIGGAFILYNTRKDSDDNEPSVVSETPARVLVEPPQRLDAPIAQVEVNQEYDRMYDYIRSQKELAEREGKTFVVLLGESHNSTNSMLAEFMIIDIARRLGISQVHIEAEAREFSKISKYHEIEMSRVRDGMPDTFKAIDNPEIKDFATKASLMYPMKLLDYDNHYDLSDKQLPTALYSVIFSKNYGMDTHPVDTAHYVQEFLPDPNEAVAMRDRFMSEEISRISNQRASLNIVGAAHAPELYRLLKEKGMHPTIVNASVDFDNMGGTVRHLPIVEERLEELRNFYKTPYSTRHQHRCDTVLGMAMGASVIHQMGKGEISQLDGRTKLNILAAIMDSPPPRIVDQPVIGR